MRELLGHDPDTFEAERFSYQVIADHARAITFLIADGVLPSNEGRGYVLRRIVRRAVRHGRLLGRREPFLATLADGRRRDHGRRLSVPPSSARPTSSRRSSARRPSSPGPSTRGPDTSRRPWPGSTTSERLVGRRADDLPADAPVLAGDVAFRLHDTYGFPIDLTIELAAEHGVRVDRDGFEAALAEQRERSRGGRKAELAKHAERTSLYESILQRVGDATFVGYETTTADGRVVAILRDGIEYQELTGNGEAEIVLDRTPFYAEGGGQVGDHGELREAGGGSSLFTVDGHAAPGRRAGRPHRPSRHAPRPARVGETVTAEVDAERRARTMRNHTGTHLLHRALRNVVGRAGPAGRLARHARTTCASTSRSTGRSRADELRAIEDEVRRIIRDARPVTPIVMTMEEAVAAGADAFFDEKYGERVRTVRVEGYSHELCGGTHCRRDRPDRRLRHHRRTEHRLRHAPHRGPHGRRRGRLVRGSRRHARQGAPRPSAPSRSRRVPERIAALQAELARRSADSRRAAAGASRSPAELAARAAEAAPRRPPRRVRRSVRLDRRAQGAPPRTCAAYSLGRHRARPRRATSRSSSSPSATTSSRAGSRAGALVRRPRRDRRQGRRAPGDGPGQGHETGGPRGAALERRSVERGSRPGGG